MEAALTLRDYVAAAQTELAVGGRGGVTPKFDCDCSTLEPARKAAARKETHGKAAADRPYKRASERASTSFMGTRR